MKPFSLLLVSLLPLSSFATTISGEATIKNTIKSTTNKVTTKTTPPKTTTQTIVVKKSTTTKVTTPTYVTGPKGGCYYLVKDKKTGKMVKKYVDKTLCKK